MPGKCLEKPVAGARTKPTIHVKRLRLWNVNLNNPSSPSVANVANAPLQHCCKVIRVLAMYGDEG